MARDDEIVLKRSGKRARLEITLDDLDAPTVVYGPAGGELDRATGSQPAQRANTSPAGVGAPPPRTPRIRYLHDDEGPWWRTRRAAWIAGALLAVLVVGVVSAIVLTAGAEPEEIAFDELSTTHTVVVGAMNEVNEATKLAALRDAGRRAGNAIDELDSPEATVRDIDDEQIRAAAAALIGAERGYLAALEELQSVNRAMISERSAAGWQEIRRRIADRQREVVSAGEHLNVFTLPGDPAKVRVSDTEMDESLQNVASTVSDARAAVASYRRQMRSYRAAVARARGKEREINAYRRSVAQVLDSYQSDRRKVDSFVESADQIRLGESAARAYSEVQRFVADREATVRQLANFLSTAPEGARSAHKNLEVPIRDSLEGLQALETAIYEYENDPYAGTVFMSVTETPGWRRFEQASDDASSSIAQTRGAWESAVTAAIKEVKDHGDIPKRPRFPQL